MDKAPEFWSSPSPWRLSDFRPTIAPPVALTGRKGPDFYAARDLGTCAFSHNTRLNKAVIGSQKPCNQSKYELR